MVTQEPKNLDLLSHSIQEIPTAQFPCLLMDELPRPLTEEILNLLVEHLLLLDKVQELSLARGLLAGDVGGPRAPRGLDVFATEDLGNSGTRRDFRSLLRRRLRPGETIVRCNTQLLEDLLVLRRY